MINQVLTGFEGDAHQPDLSEKIADTTLGLLQIACGKTITIKKGQKNCKIFSTKHYSLLERIGAVSVFILLSPITVPCAGVGYIAKMHSTTFENNVKNRADSAATMIQKWTREYCVRKPLPSNLMESAKLALDMIASQGSGVFPKAKGGITTVYLPKSPSVEPLQDDNLNKIIIKESGGKSTKRLAQMNALRAILKLKNCTHLVIPRAGLLKIEGSSWNSQQLSDCLAEERLPIDPNTYHNMEIYLSNLQSFDQAVREMTRLYKTTELGDLVNPQYHPICSFQGERDYIRYDNLPLYLVEEDGKQVGKIGLIDLEHISNHASSPLKNLYPGDFSLYEFKKNALKNSKNTASDNPNFSLETARQQALFRLVKIFPYHLDVIKEEARSFGEIDTKVLDKAAEQGREYIKLSYQDHLAWLTKKSVSKQLECQSFDVSETKIAALGELYKEELLRINQGKSDRITKEKERYSMQASRLDCIIHDASLVDTMAKRLSKTILSIMQEDMNSDLQVTIAKMARKNITNAQMVNLRSPLIVRESFNEKIEQVLVEESNLKLKPGTVQVQVLANVLIDVMLEDLVASQELFAYHSTDLFRWIRY